MFTQVNVFKHKRIDIMQYPAEDAPRDRFDAAIKDGGIWDEQCSAVG